MESFDIGLGVHAPGAVVFGREDSESRRDESALVVDRLSKRRTVLEINDEEIRVTCPRFAAFLEECDYRVLCLLGAFLPFQPTGRPSIGEFGF